VNQQPLMLSPRDRPGVHFGWEFVLLLAVAGVGFLLHREDSAALRGDNLDSLYLYAAALGFVSVGAGLCLRAATPNLALGPIAYGAAMFFAENSDRGLLVTAGMTALLTVGVGGVLSAVVILLRVPAWAATLAGGFGLIAWIQDHRRAVEVAADTYRPGDHALIWFAVFAGLSVLGGLFGLAPAVRRAVGGYRPEGDPADRGGLVGGAVLGLIGSSAFAAASGVLLALYNRSVSPGETGLGLTGLAIGVALLGGTSIYGRLGGALGTLLSVLLVTLCVAYAGARGWVLNNLAIAAVAIGLGLVVTRMMEAWARGRARPIGGFGTVAMSSGGVGGGSSGSSPRGGDLGAGAGGGAAGSGSGFTRGSGLAGGSGFGDVAGGSEFADPPGSGPGSGAGTGAAGGRTDLWGNPQSGTGDGWPALPASPPDDRWENRWGR
jgi:hypothetical protein